MSLRAALLSTALFPLLAAADTVAVVHVDVKNPPAAATFRCPPAGDYTFRAAGRRVRADFPDGTAIVFDFDKKLVWTMDTRQKTFYELKMGEFLSLGDRVSPGIARNFGPTNRVTLEPLVGQDDGKILGQTASPYNLYLGSHIDPVVGPDEDKPSKPRRGQNPNTPAPGVPAYVRPSSYGVEVAGALWLANYQPGDTDRGDLAVAELCAVFRGAPGLKIFADQLRKANRTVLGGDLSVSIIDTDGNPPATPPLVSLQAKSFASTPAVESDFTVPPDYKKAVPPDVSLGLDG